jgi:hypothetical protein
MNINKYIPYPLVRVGLVPTRTYWEDDVTIFLRFINRLSGTMKRPMICSIEERI